MEDINLIEIFLKKILKIVTRGVQRSLIITTSIKFRNFNIQKGSYNMAGIILKNNFKNITYKLELQNFIN